MVEVEPCSLHAFLHIFIFVFCIRLGDQLLKQLFPATLHAVCFNLVPHLCLYGEKHVQPDGFEAGIGFKNQNCKNKNKTLCYYYYRLCNVVLW